MTKKEKQVINTIETVSEDTTTFIQTHLVKWNESGLSEQGMCFTMLRTVMTYVFAIAPSTLWATKCIASVLDSVLLEIEDAIDLQCPHCDQTVTVQHLNWSAIVCLHCKEEVNIEEVKLSAAH